MVLVSKTPGLGALRRHLCVCLGRSSGLTTSVKATAANLSRARQRRVLGAGSVRCAMTVIATVPVLYICPFVRGCFMGNLVLNTMGNWFNSFCFV